ncbi:MULTISPECIES: YkvA family protein [unclassified Pseudomonas]|uniref:YkvA family protein n=1 Tax=unclassified Pseudomonas TaxID=196821 RepID=UPI00244A3B69|nr:MULTISPECIES: YkvA family protein [unclassified Pseudomonas]MDH0301189.1 YkvA family protein [Pseudomonas sp. GD04091]MDH1988244.1 YkvA family protein [Pseudomonas sp. GD03689]
MSAPWNFARFLPLAERLLSRGRLPALLFAVARKGPKLGQLREDLRLMQALCLAWWRGEYRAVSPKALITIVAGLLYFVSPLDAIPDWLLGVGLLDDIAVLGWVLKTVADELARFKAWRASQAPERLRVVERLPDNPEALRLERPGS